LWTGGCQTVGLETNIAFGEPSGRLASRAADHVIGEAADF